jgi:signal peptidase II
LPANRYVLFLLITGLGLAADLWTKSYFFQHHFQPDLLAAGKPQPVHWWIDGVLGVQCHTNPGALFGFGKGYSFYFAIVSIVALMGIVVWLFWFKQAIDRWLTFSLGMISAGILGNMYDRFGLGYKPEYPVEIRDNVRDWIYFYLQGVRGFQPWPNFNIADSLLVTGAFLIFLHAIFVKDETAASRPLKT